MYLEGAYAALGIDNGGWTDPRVPAWKMRDAVDGLEFPNYGRKESFEENKREALRFLDRVITRFGRDTPVALCNEHVMDFDFDSLEGGKLARRVQRWQKYLRKKAYDNLAKTN
jgi:hypothetical protein